MFKIFAIASALGGACLLALAPIPSVAAMPYLALGPAKSGAVTEVRYGHHGFRGARHFGRHQFGGGYRRHRYTHSPYYSYGYAPRYYSYGSYYRPHYYPHSYHGYGHGYGW